MAEKEKNRVRADYETEVVPYLVKKFGYKNVNEVPKLVKIVINGGKSAEDGVDAGHNIISRLRQPLHQAAEKTFLLLFHSQFLLYLSNSSSIRLTLTRVETPFSCMVIPYSRSAAIMVPLRWVMTMNWVCLVSLWR